jgi:hypothetical protein
MVFVQGENVQNATYFDRGKKSEIAHLDNEFLRGCQNKEGLAIHLLDKIEKTTLIKPCGVCWMWKMLVEAQMGVGGDVVKNTIADFQIANYCSALSTSTHVYQLINFEDSISTNDIFPNIPSDLFIFVRKYILETGFFFQKNSTFLKMI